MSPNVPADSDGPGVCVEGLGLTRWGWSERGEVDGRLGVAGGGRTQAPCVLGQLGGTLAKLTTFSHPWSGSGFTVWLCLTKAACNVTPV